MKAKAGISVIVMLVFILVIASVVITSYISITGLLKNNNEKPQRIVDENLLVDINKETIIDYSVYYTVQDEAARIYIEDNSSNIVMFTCMKVYDENIPNVADANWEYTNYFDVADSGEYLIYAKDNAGNISNAKIVYVEI